MSNTVFKEVRYTLDSLISYIQLGEVGLPDIQRPFVWKKNKVRDLFDSMYRGYPVGYFLFWQNALNGEHTRSIGTDHKQKIPRLLIVDGQQRLTSLYAVLKGIPIVRDDYSEELIKIAFRPTDGKFEVSDAAIQRSSEYIPNISELWDQKNDIFDIAENYLERLSENREVDREEQKRIKKNIQKLHSLLSYPFTALELSANIDEEQVSEVFVRINSAGKNLNQSDFILTLMSVFWDEGRKELEQFCMKSRTPADGTSTPFNHFIKPDPDQLLRVSVGLGFKRARLRFVYLLLRGKDLETGKFDDQLRIDNFETLKNAQTEVINLQHWHDFLHTIRRAGFRSGKMLTSDNNLIFAYILYLIGLNDFKVNRFELKRIISQWFFMSNLTGRYTGSPESQMEQDLNRVKEISTSDEFLQMLNRVCVGTLTNDYWEITLPEDLSTSAARSPSLFSYYAALNLLDADILFADHKVSDYLDPQAQGNRSSAERHHLFPKAYLARNGVTDTRITNQIANYALVSWDDNTSISDKSPEEYYPKYALRFNEDKLDKMKYWHALPDDWSKMDYQDFLEARRKMMAKVIRDGYEKMINHQD